LLNFYRVI